MSSTQRGQIRGDNDSARAAYIHACQLKLLLRRARSEETGVQKSECLTRLLQGLEHICASLEWLTSGGLRAKVAPKIQPMKVAIPGSFPEFGNLSPESFGSTE